MKKFLVLIFIIFFSSSFCFAKEPYKLSVKKDYTIDSLRQEAFRNIKKTIDVSMYEPIDPNLLENKEAMKKQKSIIKNRIISLNTSGNYAIKVLEDFLLDKSFAYNSSGKLLSVAIEFYSGNASIDNFINPKKLNYPIKSYEYTYPDGKLDSVIIEINSNKGYIFNPDGTLFAYWVGTTYYNSQDKPIGTSKTLLY